MKVIKTPRELSRFTAALVAEGKRIGLVPTMGFLHEGHLSLLRLLDGNCDIKAASIFVNPIQFGKNEDLDKYPRDINRDLKLLEDEGCELLFMPDAKDMYPDDFQTFVDVEELSKPLCGNSRPGHFRGVATIVLRLFNIFHCHVAAFGLKDFQQAQVIAHMVKDLNLDVELMFGETVREPDGLAMSSRNAYLSRVERQEALNIPKALEWARREALKPGTGMQSIRDGITRILEEAENLRIEYIEIVDPETLTPRIELKERNQLAVAVKIGNTRLIDNIRIGCDTDSNKIKGIEFKFE